MNIVYKKIFTKQYLKLLKHQQMAVDAAILSFNENPNAPQLRNHALFGKKKGMRSIDAAFDLRIIFIEHGEYTVVFLLEVGTHNQLYG